MVQLIPRSSLEKDFKEFFNGGNGRKKDYIGNLIIVKARGLNCRLQIIDKMPRLDMPIDNEYGIIKVIFKTPYYNEYKINIGEERYFDTLFVIGLDKDKETIKKVFAIPAKDLIGKRYITITENSQMYQKFQIDKTPYVQVYNNIKMGKYSIQEDVSIVQAI